MQELFYISKSNCRGIEFVVLKSKLFIVGLFTGIKMIAVKNSYNLTEREYEVLKLLLKGYSNPEIAKKLCISCHTAKAHVCSIIHKMKVSDRVQAIIKAIGKKSV